MTEQPFVSLYRRFRPGRFEELRGQEHVVRALRGAVRDGRVAHAYLFSGPRGTGKTSSARILAKALNCAAPKDGEPCGECTSCREIALGNSLDVHELDAASNNGVDAMRDLVAHAALGTPGRWKIYIVDEVHMLSTAAANALLKTLEEPPQHVVFVLATTDPQKVPATIRSRTQHLEFRLLGADTLIDLLASVTEQAGLAVDAEGVAAAVRRGRGSARDALSALDQIAAAGGADAARPELASLVSAIAESDTEVSLVKLSELTAGGWGPQQLATELVDELRQLFLVLLSPNLCTITGEERDRGHAVASNMGLPRIVRALEGLGTALVDMRDAPDAQVVLEIAVVRSTRIDLDTGVEALAQRVEALERALASGVMSTTPSRAAPPAPTDAEVATGTTAPSGERRPSVGAVRRRQAAEKPPESAAAVPSPPKGPVPSTPAAENNVDKESTATTSVVDRDSLTQAWGDAVLAKLPLRVKAAFSAGRFVAADHEGAQFALPDDAHRLHCLDMVPAVEKALSTHFGSAVRIVLVVDGGQARNSKAPGRPARAAESAPPDDDIDPGDAFGDGQSGDADQASEAESRLMKAFPGATEVNP